MSEVIEIVDYNPGWPRMFEEERASLLPLIGQYVEDIQHTGSTSVPGLAAKPVIDILIAVRGLALVEKCVGPIEGLGYGYLGENGLPGRHFFRKPGGRGWHRTHHIHMVLKGSSEWENQTRFRDYLRAHPETRQQYQDLKQELAARFGDDRRGYTDAKQDFVIAVLKQTGYIFKPAE
jgi:GrpB-like predicted nucleotidyltransferase (UPF0157 family)